MSRSHLNAKSRAKTVASGTKPPPPPTPEAEREWDLIQRSLRSTVPESTFTMWLEPLRPTVVRAGTLHLTGPAATCTWVDRRFMPLIDHAIAASSAGVDRISFETLGTAAPTSSTGPLPSANPTHTFDRFVIGPGNHLAHSSALAVAEAPSEAYNPLFLHGSPGLGKTHLLGAVTNYLNQHAPELNVLYTNAESFTSEFVSALREDGTEAFKARHRDLDVLLVDDIQFIAGKPRTEEEFFHTFNTLHEAGAQIVITADRTPSDISTLADRLSDRFEWGLTVELSSPNLATRLTVLRHLVKEAGLDIPDQEALTLLARRVESNVRQLHGALTRTVAEASLHAVPITSELVATLLPGTDRTSSVAITPELIRECAAAHYGLSVEDLCGRRRDHRTRDSRNLAIYLTREMTGLSMPQIGKLYGNRDHTTILSSLRRVKAVLETDPELSTTVDTIRARIHSPADRD